MRVILKPGGLAFLFLGIAILAGLAIVNKRGTNTVAVAPANAELVALSKPTIHRVEAEDSGRGESRRDTTASGGKYVHVSGNYEPMAYVPTPTTDDTFSVWARVRQTAVQLKGTPEGTQKEYAWNFDAPKQFRWVRLGRHTRAELGDSVVFIRGEGDNQAGSDGLDAVLFAPDDAFNPETDL